MLLTQFGVEGLWHSNNNPERPSFPLADHWPGHQLRHHGQFSNKTLAQQPNHIASILEWLEQHGSRCKCCPKSKIQSNIHKGNSTSSITTTYIHPSCHIVTWSDTLAYNGHIHFVNFIDRTIDAIHVQVSLEKDLVMSAANLTETSAPYLRKSNTLLARDVPSRKLAQTWQRFPLVFFCQQPLPHQLGSVNQQPALFTDRRTVCQQSKRGTIKQIKKQDDRSLQALVIKY